MKWVSSQGPVGAPLRPYLQPSSLIIVSPFEPGRRLLRHDRYERFRIREPDLIAARLPCKPAYDQQGSHTL